MILRITLKDPDGVWDALEEAFGDPIEMDPDAERYIKKYVRYKEYVTIEIDTVTGKARVVPV